MAQFDTKELVIGGTEWKTAPFRFSKMFTLGGGSGQSYIDVLLSGVSPLALTNALGLNYIKALGATEQRNLPSEYTQVEYLESTGTQYIDLGYPIDGTMSFNLKTRCLAPGFVFGSRTNSTYNVSSLNYDEINSLFGIRMGNTIVYNSTSWTVNTDYEIYISNSDVKINGTIVSTTAYGTSFYSGHAYLFTLNNNGVPGASSYSINRIYYFQMFRNGVLTQNLIPARRNSDNVLGMYDTVTGDFLTNSGTGTFTAGADVTPTPDNPMDIVSNNGVVKVSKNLFDKETLTDGYITDRGDIASSSVSAYSAAIPVMPNTTYVLSGATLYDGASSLRIHGYSAQDVWVEMLKKVPTSTPTEITNPIVFTTGSTDYFVRISYTKANMQGIQLEQGSTATPYTPYSPTGIYTDGTVETINMHRKNLFDKNTVTQGYIYNAQLEYVTSDTGSLSDYIPVVAGQPYTFTGHKEMVGSFNIRVNYFDANKEIQSQDVQSVGQGDYNFTITIPSGIKYLRYSFRTEMSDSQQLELGSTATEYEPYYNGGTATAEMLLKVQGIKDNQELLTGNIIRNIGIKVFDGTETIAQSTYGNVFLYDGITDRVITKDTALCTHFTYSTSGTGSIPNNDFGVSGTSVRVFFRNDSFTIAEQFKQWLATQYANGTPVIVVYPLATPTTETVSGQSLTASGNCTVTATGSLDNLELELSYKQSI